jgi:putative hydrolase of the HAD superfamily
MRAGLRRAIRMASERVWLFDLDNTLHNAAVSAFALLDASMNDYIARELQVDLAEADRLRLHYWHRYGATLLGLMRHHAVKPAHFLHHTHVLPTLESLLAGHRRDLAALRHLKGRKYVFTNAPSGYAERVLRHFGLMPHFDGVIGIEQMRVFGQWRPKPDERMLRVLAARLRVPTHRCVLVEDTLSNQKAAHRVGMRAVWMQRWARRGSHGPEVGVYLHRRPAYVCARIVSLQQLRRVP